MTSLQFIFNNPLVRSTSSVVISIAYGGKDLGQFSEDQVASLHQSGAIDDTAHYWIDGMVEWRPITEIVQTPAEEIVSTRSLENAQNAVSTNNQVAHETELSSDQLRDLWKRRSNAFAVDLLFCVTLFALALALGDITGALLLLCGTLYFFLKDGLPNGQSIGKRIFGIRVVKQDTGLACGLGRSLHRNGLFWLAAFGLPFVVSAILSVFLKVGVVSLGLIGGYAFWFLNGEREKLRQPPFGQMQTDKASRTRVVRSSI